MYYKFSIIRSLAAFILITFASISVAGQSSVSLDEYGRWINLVSEPWWFSDSVAKEDILAMQRKWVQIEDEIQALGERTEFPGTYFAGSDTHGSYLRWAPASGFVLLSVNKCEARVMAFSYGSVVASSVLVQLLPEKSVSDSGKHGHGQQRASRFVPVKWMGSLQLVTEDGVGNFCDYTAGLGNYNDWAGNYIELLPFFSRQSERASSGLPETSSATTEWEAPDVPPGYERLVRKPISARIVSVGRSYLRCNPQNDWWDELVTPVTLQLSREGVKRKMKLYVSASEEIIEISSPGRRSARGIIVRSVRKRPCVKFDDTDDCSEPDYPSIQIGWKASTYRS